MSMLHVGSRCAICSLIDFLPTTCNSCDQIFCGDHIHKHNCQDQETIPSTIAGPSTFIPKAKCEVTGCERATIEAIGGRIGTPPSSTPGTSDEVSADVAREVRCGACNGSFCVAHRQQAAHKCSGPLDYTHRSEAAIARKAKAQEILAKRFPDQVGRTIPKPPPSSHDVPLNIKRAVPTSGKVSSNTQLAIQTSNSQTAGTDLPAPSAKTVSKTKNQKLYDIHLRKIRSLAVPLDPAWKADSRGRIFFEINVGLSSLEDMRNWEATGKWGKPERAWVYMDTPLGKVFDLLITKGKVARDSTQALSLLALHAAPDHARRVVPLDLASPASSIPEGCLVTVARDWASGSKTAD